MANEKITSFEEFRRKMFGNEEVDNDPWKDEAEGWPTNVIEVNFDKGDDDEANALFDKFINKNIYPGLISLGVADSIKANASADCDAEVCVGDKKVFIDIKNRISVFNVYDPTLSFEIYSVNNEELCIHTGWSISPNDKSDYMLFMHCFIDDSRKWAPFNKKTVRDIIFIDMLLVKKDDLFAFFKDCEKEYGKKISGGVVEINTIKQFPHTRVFNWTGNEGVIELVDKKHRPPLSPSER